MRSSKKWPMLTTMYLLLSLPGIVLAEPAPSLSHRPFLWVLSAAIATLLGWPLINIIRRMDRFQSPFIRWGLILMLMVVLLVIVAPVIVALGSILITGRTM